MELEPQTNNDEYSYNVKLEFKLDDVDSSSKSRESQSDTNSSDASEELQLPNVDSFGDDAFSFATPQEP